MRDYITIGSTPCDEECAQVGAEGYMERVNKECRVYIRQLWRQLLVKGITPHNAPETFNLVVKGNAHDFGTYFEVAIRYDDSNQEAMELALDLENLVPTNWDEEAKKELKGIKSFT